MAKGFPGVDSTVPVSDASIATATGLLGTRPVFWGRYFKTKTSPVGIQYDAPLENAVLGAADIRVAPVARQTNRVNGTEDYGRTDGYNNADALIAAFGVRNIADQGDQFLMFLDIEGAGQPSLSVEYYTGWSQSLRARSKEASNDTFELLPCVYGRSDDQITWDALRAADIQGDHCYGAWVFREKQNACEDRFVDFDTIFCTPCGALPFPILNMAVRDRLPGRQRCRL